MRRSKTVDVGLNTITSRAVQWLWPWRIPLGKLSLIVGDPGKGKSFITLDMASRMSVGKAWPTGEPNPVANTILLGMEDDLEDTIRPRVDVMGGDPSRIFSITGIKVEGVDGTRHPDLSLDLLALHDLVCERQAKLVVIDPISAYMGDADTHKDAEVRSVLTPIANMASATGCAVVGIMHLNKNQMASAVYRIGMSIAFPAVARTVHMVGEHPDDKTKCVMVNSKANLRVEKAALGYQIEDVIHPVLNIPIGRVKWEDETFYVDPEELVGPPPTEEEVNELGELKEYVRALLGDEWVSRENIEKSVKGAGYNVRKLETVKKSLGIISKRHKDWWLWHMPVEKGGT